MFSDLFSVRAETEKINLRRRNGISGEKHCNILPGSAHWRPIMSALNEIHVVSGWLSGHRSLMAIRSPHMAALDGGGVRMCSFALQAVEG